MWKAEVRNGDTVVLTVEDDGEKALSAPPVSVVMSLDEAESLGSFLSEVAARAKTLGGRGHKRPGGKPNED